MLLLGLLTQECQNSGNHFMRRVGRTVIAAGKTFPWIKKAPQGTKFVLVNYVIALFFLMFPTCKAH